MSWVGSSRFSAERDPSQPPNRAWTIVHKGERHVTHKLYLTIPGPHGNEWVSTILGVAESDPTGVYDRVDFFFLADIPSDVPGNHTIIHCNPDYHSYPWERRSWHDWIMVKWTTGLQVYEHAAHLLLIAHFMDTTNNRTKDICAVNSLSGNKPKPDNLLPFFNGDTIEQVVRVVPAENVLSEAYVLPTIEKVGDEFPDNVELADYFVVIPERAKWMGIGMQLIDEYEEET